ncbi:SMP-30/gluconolactonase/LRE family protein [Spirosoma sp. KUDC1026]|uniref:SMP-30/gluconolactonase/LRE family protein n=1 Tax=Spirosoma sp. KUDC1026 TaxID=2745947 RepID=UPI00159B8C9B|nr:SMP-30/gluconolactonase/LRE family protein [Spirosoma sp. KUDC1026]QKZ12760.1 SMP-30/gluconolactonase/LRE family protein [Spirosoma sp. KUDC1026]
MKKAVLLTLIISGLIAACQDHREFPVQNQNIQPKIAYSFPEQYNTPDGLAITPDNNMLVSINNAGNPVYPAVILRLTDQGYTVFATPTPNPSTGKASPFDLAYGPDGNVYYADNQFTNDPNYKSRLMRIRIVNGQATTIEPVVEGFRLSNAVLWKGNTVYVTDSQWDLPGIDNGSAIFKFTLAELTSSSTPIRLQPMTVDPHILTTFVTQLGPDGDDLGCDGIDYDSQGNLFTGLFGNGQMYKMTLNADGSLASKTEFAKLPCVDGLVINRETNNVYVCDAKNNAIRIVSPAGVARVVAQNGDTDGADGRLDEPAEPLLRNNKLYISNYDTPQKGTINTKSDAPHTIVVLE